MAGLAGTFGIAVQNFTAYPQMPDAKALVEYGVRMEQLGFDSLWVWDHILLGVEPNFPIVYMSGTAGADWTSHGVPNSIMLEKPFAPAQLVTAVSQLLNTGSSPNN